MNKSREQRERELRKRYEAFIRTKTRMEGGLEDKN